MSVMSEVGPDSVIRRCRPDVTSLPRSPQLRDQSRLLQLRERPGDLPHGHLERVVGDREVVAAGREHPDAAGHQRDDAELAGEPAGVLDEDDPDAVALDPVEGVGRSGRGKKCRDACRAPARRYRRIKMAPRDVCPIA
jgi:hypothetical protein